MRKLMLPMIAALTLTLSAGAQPSSDPVADLFVERPPTPAGADTPPPAPLRNPEPAVPPGGFVMRPPVRTPPPRTPALELEDGNRVVFLGDAILEAEAQHGYLETRLVSNFPRLRTTFMNLSSSPHNRLREAAVPPFGPAEGWWTNLLAEVRAARPDVIVLSYGTAVARAHTNQLGAFTNLYAEVIEGLRRTNASGAAPRLVLLSPLSYEPPDGGTYADATNHEPAMLEFANAVWQLATNRQCAFGDLVGSSRAEIAARLRGTNASATLPRFTEDGVRPTRHGARRWVIGLDRTLRLRGNNWRWGLMPDNQWRDGGFGASFVSQSRTDQSVKVVFTEERLPTPKPAAPIDLQAESKPQCYIQVPGLKPGLYELRVDGRPLLKGTHEEWGRYEIIADGPSWEQAEALRQLIVRKNAAWERGWAKQRANGFTGAGEDPDVAELEKQIDRLKKPVQRTYEIVRLGDAPAK